MSAVYPYHPDRPRNLINTNKLFDLYAAEESEDGTPSSTSVPVRLAKPSKSALITRRKTKRKVPARLKLLWDEEVTTPTSPVSSTQTVQSTSDSTETSPSLKSEPLPICLQAPAIDSILPVLHPHLPSQPKSLLDFALPSKTLTDFQQDFQQSKPLDFESQTSVRFTTFSNPKEEESEQQPKQEEEQIYSSFTLQHLFYIICIGALIVAVYTQLVESQSQEQRQTQILPLSLTSATLTPSSLNAVRIFVTQHRSQFSFTLRTTRLLFSR